MSTDAERLATWVRQMPLADQILVTGATLILADVKARNPGVFDALDEVALRESQLPADAARVAASAASRYQSVATEDGRRVVSLCNRIAEVVIQNFPVEGRA